MLGFGMLLAVLFRAGDLTSAAGSPTGFPFMAIFQNAVGSLSGANVMITIVVIMSIAGSISPLAAASRMMWSFSRDQGLPWSRILSKVCFLVIFQVKCLSQGTDQFSHQSAYRYHFQRNNSSGTCWFDQYRVYCSFQRCCIAYCGGLFVVLPLTMRIVALQAASWRNT